MRPNVKRLARKQKTDRLAAVLRYEDWARTRGGGEVDLGIETRCNAIVALAGLPDPTVSTHIASALDDGAPAVRLAAIAALGARPDDDAGWSLINNLRRAEAEGDNANAAATLDALCVHATDRARQVVTAIIQWHARSGLDGFDKRLLSGLAQSSPEAADLMISALIDAMDIDSALIRERACLAVVALAPRSLPALAAALEDAGRRPIAALALASCGDGRAVEPLIELLRDGDPGLRPAAAVMLGEMRDPAASEVLLEASLGDDHATRVAAAAALNKLGLTGLLLAGTAMIRHGGLGRLASGLRPALAARRQSSTTDVPSTIERPRGRGRLSQVTESER